MTNRIKGLIVILVVGISSVMVFQFSFPCLLKKVTGFPCPACGLSRAFKQILKGNIIASLNYNIIAIPLFIILTFILLLTIVQIVTNNALLSKLYKYLDKYKFIIIFLILCSWIANLVRNI